MQKVTAAILGGSIIVAAAISTGGPWRAVSVGTFPDRSVVRINTWTGETWSSFNDDEWKKLREQGETAELIAESIRRVARSSPMTTDNLSPQSESIRQLIRERDAAKSFDGWPVPPEDVDHIAYAARELAFVTAAMNDELFAGAPTERVRLKRWNQIRRAAGLPGQLLLPDELSSPEKNGR